MKKTFVTYVITALITISTLCIPVSYAAEPTSTPTATEIVSEVVKYETPYYGYSPKDFDLNNDGSIDVFDMVILKQRLIAGDPELTVATAVKLQSYLLGKPYGTLEITTAPTTWFNPSDYRNDCLKNLTSHDFRFVHAEESVILCSNGETKPAVALYFLGIDEYIIESVFITNFCNTTDEFDEFVTATEGPGFYIGIKDGKYAMAVKPATTIDTTPAESSTGNTFKGSNVISIKHEPEYEEITEERKLGPALAQYDLTVPNLSTKEVRQIVNELSNYLKAEPFTFTTKAIDSDKIQLSCNTALADMEIIVRELEPLKDTPIFETDEFYLFYDNSQGFGICLK